MPKLLMVATVPDALTAFLLPYVRHFRAQGWQVDGMAAGISNSSECLQEFDRVWDVEWSRNPLDVKNLTTASKSIKEAIAKENYDIIHTHTPVASFVTRYILNSFPKQNKPKVIYTAHGFHFHPRGNWLKNAIFMTLEKIAGNWTDYLVTINRHDQMAANKYRFLPPERIYYMPGIGVDTGLYNGNDVGDGDILKVRDELGLAPSDRLFTAVAEFTANKRHCDMVAALAKLGRSQVHLALAGDGPKPLMDKIRQMAVDLGVAERVHFLGYRKDVPVLIRASEAVILTSEREGLPRSVMESLCLETPVIGTDIRGIQDLVGENCGKLVPVKNPTKLADAMGWILDHPEEAKIMGKQGRERMANFDVSHLIELHEKLYAGALGMESLGDRHSKMPDNLVSSR